MLSDPVAHWADAHPLSPAHVDCATAVMLKILDGKCKMHTEEKRVMSKLYDAVWRRPGVHLGLEIHRLIRAARRDMDEPLRERIYETRVLAETRISRPVMKAFKAMLREHGLFSQA